MKHNAKILTLNAVILVILAAVLYSCGGYGGGGMMGGGTTAPGAFSLTSPTSGMNPVGTTPTLMWTASSNATTGYEVQIEVATGTFTGTTMPVDVVVGMTTYSVPMSAGLVKGTQYHWRVKAENIYGSMIAGPFTFTS